MRTPLLARMATPVGGHGICQSLLLFVFCCTFISCGHTNEQSATVPPDSPKAETPKALQEKSSLGDVSLGSSSSRGDDLVESLYRELAKKDPALVELEAHLERLPDKRLDSTKLFNTFNEKNQEYYGSARRYTDNIKDSVLRKKMEALIAASDTAYESRTARHRRLLAGIDGKQLSMDDLHAVLKLTRTLPVMEQYQKGHLPGVGSLQHILEEYEGTVRQEEKLIEK